MANQLIIKLAEIMAEVGYIPKNGYNTFHKYYYATESDVQDAVRDKLASRKMMMIPSVVESSLREVTTRNGNTEFIYRVKLRYLVIDGESGESLEFFVEGEGQDTGDKGVYKATTGAQKYAIMKLFQIPTGDDPELNSAENLSSAPTDTGKKNKNGAGIKEDPRPKPADQGGGNGGGNYKRMDDKEFFDRRDALLLRVGNLAAERQTSREDILDYVIKKANDVQGKSYRALNSVNLQVAETIVTKLEAATRTDNPDPGPAEQAQLFGYNGEPK